LLAALDDPKHAFGATEVLEFAYDVNASFAPGAGWKYSNTNYVLAGMVIDAAAGRHHSEEIRDRVLRPLALKETAYWRRQPLGGELARGYVGEAGGVKDVTDFAFSRGLADLGMIASVSDLARFVEAVGNDRDGGAFPMKAREEVFRSLVPTESGGYGLGVQVFDLGGRGELAVGHSGTIVGYRSEMFYVPGKEISLAIAANRSQPSQVFDDLIVEVMRAVLD